MKTKCGHPICGGIIMDEKKYNQIAEELNISKSQVKYYIGKLSKAHRLAREGTSQKGKWIVL